jgi:hypothetical protein
MEYLWTEIFGWKTLFLLLIHLQSPSRLKQMQDGDLAILFLRRIKEMLFLKKRIL